MERSEILAMIRWFAYGGSTDERLQTMDAKTYHYEVFLTSLDDGQQCMVQIFRDPENGRVLHSQLAFKNALGSWGVPYQLEKM
jgi:hypothetical protein